MREEEIRHRRMPKWAHQTEALRLGSGLVCPRNLNGGMPKLNMLER